MGIRDEELLRLKRYAEGMGIRVSFTARKVGEVAAATWDMSENLITITVGKRDSKIDTILYFIHELGHQVSFVHDDNRQHPSGLLDAMAKENEDQPLSRRERKLILESEFKGMKWWSVIYKDTDMKFPKYKLYYAREYDAWVYTFFYNHGKYPTTKQCKAKHQQLKKLYNSSMNIDKYEQVHGL
ncbi:MAG: hypothetical protein RLZZ181_115 [Pseudomonadota bacterium]|jgi:hypothetical protein